MRISKVYNLILNLNLFIYILSNLSVILSSLYLTLQSFTIYPGLVSNTHQALRTHSEEKMLALELRVLLLLLLLILLPPPHYKNYHPSVITFSSDPILVQSRHRTLRSLSLTFKLQLKSNLQNVRTPRNPCPSHRRHRKDLNSVPDGEIPKWAQAET